MEWTEFCVEYPLLDAAALNPWRVAFPGDTLADLSVLSSSLSLERSWALLSFVNVFPANSDSVEEDAEEETMWMEHM